MLVSLPPADSCRIEYQETAGLAHLSAVLVPAGSRQGTYQFQVMSASNGGTSSNMQAGEFSAGAGRQQNLSQAVVNGSPNKWTADLRVYDTSGKLLCRSTLPESE